MQLYLLKAPYTLALAISAEKFQHVIEEDKVVVGNPIIVINNPSGSIDLANIVSKVFEERKTGEEVRAVIIRNYGVVTVGNNIHQARAVVEALEKWAKIYTTTRCPTVNRLRVPTHINTSLFQDIKNFSCRTDKEDGGYILTTFDKVVDSFTLNVNVVHLEPCKYCIYNIL
jgi:ribulose-5-phosphate 4-epimerase/fuculose-1-phosphate aldolase